MWTQNFTQRRQDRNHRKCKLFGRNYCSQFDSFFSYFVVCRTYPVYAVGDYAGGQQYYATTTSNFTASSSSSNGNANSNSYIVPVDEAILGVNQSRGSPQTISTVSLNLRALFFQINFGCKACRWRKIFLRIYFYSFSLIFPLENNFPLLEHHLM